MIVSHGNPILVSTLKDKRLLLQIIKINQKLFFIKIPSIFEVTAY